MGIVESDRSFSGITFELTTRVTVDGRTAIVLHLFRDGASVLNRTIVTVEHRDAVSILLVCRADLERRGVAQQEDDVPLRSVRRTALVA